MAANRDDRRGSKFGTYFAWGFQSVSQLAPPSDHQLVRNSRGGNGGAGYRWVVGQDLDNKSVIVLLLSNECPTIVQTLSKSRVCPNLVQILSSSCPQKLVLSSSCHFTVLWNCNWTLSGCVDPKFVQILSNPVFLKHTIFYSGKIVDNHWTWTVSHKNLTFVLTLSKSKVCQNIVQQYSCQETTSQFRQKVDNHWTSTDIGQSLDQ